MTNIALNNHLPQIVQFSFLKQRDEKGGASKSEIIELATHCVNLNLHSEAEHYIDRALESPDCVDADTVSIANLLLRMNRPEKALALLLRLDQNPIGCLEAKANAYMKLQRYDQAQATISKIKVQSGSTPETDYLELDLLERTGRYKQLLRATEKYLNRHPKNAQVVSFYLTACTATGEHPDANIFPLHDLIRFYKPGDATPDTSLPIAANTKIIDHFEKQRDWIPNPKEFATRNGEDYPDFINLVSLTKPEIQDLALLLTDSASQYLQETSHRLPLWFSAPPIPLQLRCWATKLGQDGYQKAHIHPDAWLSGVYYVSVGQSDQSGGEIEFGYFGPEQTFVCQNSFKPENGTVILFPSFIAHRTKPNLSGDTRMTVAFDIVGSD